MEVFDLQLNIDCPVSSQSFNISTQTRQTLHLSPDLNGIGSILSTTGVSDLYLPIRPASINIKLSSEVQKAITQALQPSNFIKAAEPENGNEMPLKRNLLPCKVLKRITDFHMK